MLNNAKPKLKNRKMCKIDRKVQKNDRFVPNYPTIGAVTNGSFE